MSLLTVCCKDKLKAIVLVCSIRMKHHRCNVAFWFETKAREDSTELSRKNENINFPNSNIINARFSCKETGQDVRVKAIDVTCMFQSFPKCMQQRQWQIWQKFAIGCTWWIWRNFVRSPNLFKLAPHIEGIWRKMASLTNFAVEWGNYGKKLFISSHDLDFRHVDTWRYIAIFENIVVYFLRTLPFICTLLSNKGQYNMKHKTP